MKLKSTLTAPVTVIVVLILTAAARFLDLSKLAYNENRSLAIIVLQLLILVVPTAFYIRLHGDEYASSLRLSVFGPERLLATLLAALTIILGTTLLKLFLYNVGLVNGAYSIWHSFLSVDENNILYNLLTFCLIPAVAEELLFRGVLCADYEKGGALTAVLMSSLCYGMFSLSIGNFLIYFFAGLGFALVLFMSRSLFAAMLCHFTVNLLDSIISETIWNIIKKPQSTVFLVFALTGLFLICLLFLFSECERIYHGYALKNESSEMTGEQTAGSVLKALLSPAFIGALFIFLAASVSAG